MTTSFPRPTAALYLAPTGERPTIQLIVIPGTIKEAWWIADRLGGAPRVVATSLRGVACYVGRDGAGSARGSNHLATALCPEMFATGGQVFGPMIVTGAANGTDRSNDVPATALAHVRDLLGEADATVETAIIDIAAVLAVDIAGMASVGDEVRSGIDRRRVERRQAREW
jgi:hypothetical protein